MILFVFVSFNISVQLLKAEHGPPQQQFGVVSVLQVLLDQISQQLFQHHCSIFHTTLKRHSTTFICRQPAVY